MVPARALPVQRPWLQRQSCADHRRRQHGEPQASLLRWGAMGPGLEFREHVAGPAGAGRGVHRSRPGRTQGRAAGLLDPGDGADGDCAMVRPCTKNPRGVALLVVLLGVALMTLIVIDFGTTAALGYLSAANQANELRAYFLARSSVAVGLGLLAEDSRMDARMQTPYDSLNDVWAVPFPPVNVDGGTVSISIIDETRKLNINQLVNPTTGEIDPQHAMVLERLFTILNIPPEIIPAIADWIDADSIPAPQGGAEMDYYLRLMPPYAPRNGLMPTIGDLKMVRGVDDATFHRLLPFVTVVPEMQVNANTAPPEVLAALSPQLFANPDLVKAIVT